MSDEAHRYAHDWRWDKAAGADVCVHCARRRGLKPAKDRAICPGAVKAWVSSIDLDPARCKICGATDVPVNCSTLGCTHHQGG